MITSRYCAIRLRADVAINGRDRPLFFSHRPLDEALGAYLDERLRAGYGLGAAEHWRGLDPHGTLFLGAEGEVYPRAVHPSFIGLHADLATTEATAKAFKVFYCKVPTGSSYNMDHTATSYVFDPA